ncbi:MAG: hypothetical protein IT301_06365 [Dehalococcoidia bacterium]|nr:hypothetical protein [Dehalococcoidia bacterium]
MTLSIAAAHTYLADNILQDLAITSPIQTSIKKAHKYFLPPAKAIADLPCAMVTFEQRTVVFGPALLHKPYTFHIVIYAAKVEDETGPEKAANFMDALITKLASTKDTLRLGGTVSLIQQLRGQTPETLNVQERGGAAFIGLDLFMDVQITTTPGYSA